MAVTLRKGALIVSLDDLLKMVSEFLNPNVSNSRLDRYHRRHGVGDLCDLRAKAEQSKQSGI